jgi:hypothetical protein
VRKTQSFQAGTKMSAVRRLCETTWPTKQAFTSTILIAGDPLCWASRVCFEELVTASLEAFGQLYEKSVLGCGKTCKWLGPAVVEVELLPSRKSISKLRQPFPFASLRFHLLPLKQSSQVCWNAFLRSRMFLTFLAYPFESSQRDFSTTVLIIALSLEYKDRCCPTP